jgi:hypothetical protein
MKASQQNSSVWSVVNYGTQPFNPTRNGVVLPAGPIVCAGSGNGD